MFVTISTYCLAKLENLLWSKYWGMTLVAKRSGSFTTNISPSTVLHWLKVRSEIKKVEKNPLGMRRAHASFHARSKMY